MPKAPKGWEKIVTGRKRPVRTGRRATPPGTRLLLVTEKTHDALLELIQFWPLTDELSWDTFMADIRARYGGKWTRQAVAKHKTLQKAFSKRQDEIRAFSREKTKNAGRRIARNSRRRGRLSQEADRAPQPGKRRFGAADQGISRQNEPLAAQRLPTPDDAPPARRSDAGERPGPVGPAVSLITQGGRRGDANPDSRRRCRRARRITRIAGAPGSFAGGVDKSRGPMRDSSNTARTNIHS